MTDVATTDHAPGLVLVVLDAGHTGVAPTAAELIGAASLIGLPAVLTTSPADVDELASLGAHTVFLAPAFGDALCVPLVDAAVAAFERCSPVAVITAHTVRGRDVAARCAVRLRRALLVDATGVERDAQGIITHHSNYGGAFSSTAAATHLSPVITLRVGSVDTRAQATQPQVVELEVTPSGARTAKVVEVTAIERTSTRPELTTADVVVAGGVSLGDEAMFEELVGGLADALGGAVGATRSAVDEGQVAYEAQIGQTGVVVSPKLYIGIGISGAVQHLVGMQTAETIVAINNDEDAPIFDITDFGIVGDIFDLVPEIINEINMRKAAN